MMKKSGLMILLSLVLCLSFVSAATLNVDVNDAECNDIIGSPYCSIQDAINNAIAGDTINVFAGTYTPGNLSWDGAGFLRIDKAITLKGAGSLNTIIDGQHLYSATIGGPHATCLWLESSDVKLEGLTIKGCDWGIRVSDAYAPTLTEISDLTFNDVTITDNYGHGIIFENYDGVIFKNVDFVDCNANANGDRGIYLNPSSISEDFTLTNTNANNNKKAGFNCQGTLDGLIINGGEFNDNTGGKNYEGNGPYFGAGLELDGVTNAEINGVEANRNGLLGPSWCIMVGGAGILLKDDTSDVKILNSELNDNANGILVEYCVEEWPTSSQPSEVVINYNNIVGNINYGISNRAPLTFLDAKRNWWGDCKGPGVVGPGNGDKVSTNVDYTPWLGICIENKTNVTCKYETDSITLKADLTGIEIEDVWFSYTINGTNHNKTATNMGGTTYSVTIPSLELVGGQDVIWNVYANDSTGRIYNNSWKTFYVRSRTKLIVDPLTPDGWNGWYIREPEFSLIKDDVGGNVYYMWDSTGAIFYAGSFGLENIPNPPEESAGTLELNWWTDFGICENETKQNKTFYIDLTNPVIKDLTPADGSTVYNNLKPKISAYLDEVYQSNSGIDKESVIFKLDGEIKTANVSNVDDLDAIVIYTPTEDLSLGEHNVTLNATDKAGRNSELTWIFNIKITPVFTMQVNSPEEKNYGSKRVLFNITLTENVEKIGYINWNDKVPKWKNLCKGCDEYGSIRKKTKNLNEGQNNITIKATDYFGQVKEENASLFIDSKEPKISKIEPTRNSVVNGSEFYIKYTEDDLQDITLFYGTGTESITKDDCLAGRNQECIFRNIDLTGYENQWIEYYFEVSDSVNTVQSRKTRVFVDTISPILTVNSPVNEAGYGRNVPFNMTVTEDVTLEYIDNFEVIPRWRRLTSNNDEYGSIKTKTKSFKKGIHNIQIRATDKAGNSDIEDISFTVDY